LEESVLTSLLPHERLWVEGMHFLFQKNEGKSLLATASVIGPSSIPLIISSASSWRRYELAFAAPAALTSHETHSLLS
jgi:hypothetical protein